ncbi:hypothetical protein BK637_29230 [Pseudomonas chlororaphis]|nr:hypothetical protein BK637_29230 [Pseudomonas chlororaphis]
MPGTGAGDAFTVFDQKQRTVGGALDQAGAGIEELVGLPLQSDPAMGAAIGVDVDLSIAAHCKKRLAFKVETSAGSLWQIAGGAKKLHVYPR